MTIVSYSIAPGRRSRVDVDDATALRWTRLCEAWGNDVPMTNQGLPLRPFPAGTYNGDAVEAGIFVNWQHDATREWAYAERNRARVDQPTHRMLAEVYGFQHPLHPYRAADCWARRVNRPVARGGAVRDPAARDYRRWSNRRWSRQAMAATAAVATEYGTRRFGVEIEFNHRGHDLHGDRDRIVAAARHQGMVGTARWGSHYREPSLQGWQFMYDCTVSGGEIVSDIMAGDTASLDEVRDMLAIVRANGGRPGVEQGMHVHHDVSDFSVADKVRLVDNLAAIQGAVEQVLPASRRGNSWAMPMQGYEFDMARQAVRANRPVQVGRYFMFNLSHLVGGSPRVEWRSLGNTLNGTKHRAWIRLGQAVSAATKAGVEFRQGIALPELLTILRGHGLTGFAERHLLARAGIRPLVAA